MAEDTEMCCGEAGTVASPRAGCQDKEAMGLQGEPAPEEGGDPLGAWGRRCGGESMWGTEGRQASRTPMLKGWQACFLDVGPEPQRLWLHEN